MDRNRAETLVSELLAAIRGVVAEQGITYDEYQTAKRWLIDVGEAGEWPLWLDVFIESHVERQAFRDRPGSAGTILGPYYLPDAPVLEPPFELPRRPDEKGDALIMTGSVTSAGGEPLAGAVLDVWQADAEGYYSGFAAGVPEGNLRGKVITDEDGGYELRTILPGPYTIPHEGPTGRMLAACGWHPWRPAHVHLKVGADGHQLLTTQIFFENGQYIDDDVADAVKEELIVRPQRRDGDPERGIEGPHLHVEYDFVLAPERAPSMVA